MVSAKRIVIIVTVYQLTITSSYFTLRVQIVYWVIHLIMNISEQTRVLMFFSLIIQVMWCVRHVQTQEQSTFWHGVVESLQPLWTLTAQSKGKRKIIKTNPINKQTNKQTEWLTTNTTFVQKWSWTLKCLFELKLTHMCSEGHLSKLAFRRSHRASTPGQIPLRTGVHLPACLWFLSPSLSP